MVAQRCVKVLYAIELYILKWLILRNSLAVQWLGFRAPTARVLGSIPIGKLRSYKPRGVAKKKKKWWILCTIYSNKMLQSSPAAIWHHLMPCGAEWLPISAMLKFLTYKIIRCNSGFFGVFFFLNHWLLVSGSSCKELGSHHSVPTSRRLNRLDL